MTSFSEQLSTVRTSPWEAQLEMFRRLSDGAIDSTEQLIALNIKASRASMEGAAGAVKQLLGANDPRDLFAVSSAAQDQLHQLLAYGRELMGIASGMRTTWSTLPAPLLPAPLHLLPAPSMNIPRSPAQAAEQAAIATAGAVTISSEIGAAATDIGGAIAAATLEQAQAGREAAQPAAARQASAPDALEAAFEASVETAIADDHPTATPTPLAKALNEAAPKPASVEHPIVSTVPLEAAESSHAVELPLVAPVERSAPVRQAQGPAAKPPRPTRRK